MYENNQLRASHAQDGNGVIGADSAKTAGSPPPVGQMLDNQYELACELYAKSTDMKNKICGEVLNKESGSAPSQSFGPTKDIVIITMQVLYATKMNMLAIENYILG